MTAPLVIREDDISIRTADPRDTSYGARYVLIDGNRRRQRYAMTKHEAIAFRADIIDERAGGAQVGDVVRIGRGRVEFRVMGVGDSGCNLQATEYPYSTRRSVEFERLHVVRAVR